MVEFRKTESFELRYFEQIRAHLSEVCAVPAPSGNALHFELMLKDLARGRPWIEFRKPGIQASLYVDETDPWISRRRTDRTRLRQLVILDLDPPKLNGLTEKWIEEWIEDTEVRDRLCGDVRRNGSNVEMRKVSLEALLGWVDEIRRESASNPPPDQTSPLLDNSLSRPTG